MLTTPKYKTNDVLTVKLVSGEEVIGYFVEENETEIVLRKPLVPVPTGEGQVGLAPFIMSSSYLREGNGNLPFNKQTVITTLPCSKDFKNAYTQQVSGLDFSAGQSNQGLIV